MTTTAPARCRQPGCAGLIEDGYCNVCGTPADAVLTPAGGSVAAAAAAGAAASGRVGPAGAAAGARAASPSAVLGTGFAEAQPATGVARAGGEISEGSTRTGRTSSARLASAALGSARTAAGSRATRRVGTSSTRLREHQLGAGLTTVPPAPVADPLDELMADPQVPEHKRFCPSCGAKVGRSRDGAPGRTVGFCPQCRTKFDFRPQLAPGDVVGGQYEVVGCLAHGGLGWIYLGRDQNVSGRWIVLKGLLNAGDAAAMAAAIAERRFLAEVEHPLIVEIYNFVMHDGAGYIVMEYVGGESLKNILTTRREAHGGVVTPLPVDQALAYILEVLPAFAYMHDRGLLYCDFKPDNIVQQGESIKLIDLGAVRRIDDLDSDVYGTVGYQAPEVATDGPSVASDIYTIGRTLATLVLDFRGNTTTYAAALPPVADTPVFQRYDSFYRLLAKACALDPSDRFATADELRAQVIGVLREVVAIDRGAGGGSGTAHSAASVLFEAPVADVAARALAWNELPALRIDEHDPMTPWLAGVNVADPRARLTALARAPEQSVEVRLAIAHAAIEVGQDQAVERVLGQILEHDPWEWRAAWLGGLRELSRGDVAKATASFNAVYGQVPGELAPKLALATACELSGEFDVAEVLYGICARTDANYTAPSAFGLARIAIGRGDVDAALTALDLVAPTRASYAEARQQRAEFLIGSGRGLPALADAMAGIDDVAIPEPDRARLKTTVWSRALAAVRADGPKPDVVIAGVQADEAPLRDALEQGYRELARLTESREIRIDLVDRANEVRRWTSR